MSTSAENCYWSIAKREVRRIHIRFLGYFSMCLIATALTGLNSSPNHEIGFPFKFGIAIANLSLGLLICAGWALRNDELRIIRSLPISRLQLGTYIWWKNLIAVPIFVQMSTSPYFFVACANAENCDPLAEWVLRGFTYVALNGFFVRREYKGRLPVVAGAGFLYYCWHEGFSLLPAAIAIAGFVFALYSYRDRENFAPEILCDSTPPLADASVLYADVAERVRFPLFRDLCMGRAKSFLLASPFVAGMIVQFWFYNEDVHDNSFDSNMDYLWTAGICAFAAFISHDPKLRQRTRVYWTLPVSRSQFVLTYGLVPVVTIIATTVCAITVAVAFSELHALPIATGPTLALGIAAAIAVDSLLPRRYFLDQAGKRLLMLVVLLTVGGYGTLFSYLRVPAGLALYVGSLGYLSYLLNTNDGVRSRYMPAEDGELHQK